MENASTNLQGWKMQVQKMQVHACKCFFLCGNYSKTIKSLSKKITELIEVVWDSPKISIKMSGDQAV